MGPDPISLVLDDTETARVLGSLVDIGTDHIHGSI